MFVIAPAQYCVFHLPDCLIQQKVADSYPRVSIVKIFKFAKKYINLMDLNAQLEYAERISKLK